MKKILTVILCVLCALWWLGKCGADGSIDSVESLYGTYVGTDNYGNNVKIVLSSKSDNEWRKYGKDYSDNLVWTDSQGRTRGMDFQTITWTWDLNDGYVQVYYDSYERYVIDIKGGMIYDSWGAYLDGRDGFSYRFSN